MLKKKKKNDFLFSHLDLDANEVAGVTGLSKLTMIEGLCLSNNALERMSSDECDNLGALDYLFVHRNKLTKLPARLGRKARKLRVLCATNNSLAALPDTWDGLESLEELYLARNKFDHVPACVAPLARLHTLHLSRNALRGLAGPVLPVSLTSLDLSRNGLEVIDGACLAPLVKLRELNVSSNALATLPKCVWTLPVLEDLNAGCNKLAHLEPPDVSSADMAWAPLVDLNLAGNDFTRNGEEEAGPNSGARDTRCPEWLRGMIASLRKEPTVLHFLASDWPDLPSIAEGC
jgi:Leucine-rich repeat (LRR) protein